MIILLCIFVFCGIAALIYSDRDRSERTSWALWLPGTWLLINGSRPVSTWIAGGQNSITAAQISEGNVLDARIFALLILLGVLVLNHRWSAVSRIILANRPLLLFFLFCAVSLAWSEFPAIAFKRLVKAFGDVAMVLIVLSDPNPLAALKRVFLRAAMILLPLSVFLIVFVPHLGTAYDPSNSALYYVGVADQKNTLGQICMVCGLASLWALVLAYQGRHSHRRIGFVVICALMFSTASLLIVLANSVTSLSCLALAGTVLVMASRKEMNRHLGAVHALVASSIALAVFAAFLDTAGALLNALGRNTTLTGRTTIWKTVLMLHTSPLVGTGFESFWLGRRLQFVWNRSDYGILQAHNGYLETYINLGWIGVVLLAMLIFYGYRNAINVFRYDRQAGMIRISFFVAALMFSLTEAGFRIMNPIWFAFLIATTSIPLDLLRAGSRARTSVTATRIKTSHPFRVLQ